MMRCWRLPRRYKVKHLALNIILTLIFIVLIHWWVNTFHNGGTTVELRELADKYGELHRKMTDTKQQNDKDSSDKHQIYKSPSKDFETRQLNKHGQITGNMEPRKELSKNDGEIHKSSKDSINVNQKKIHLLNNHHGSQQSPSKNTKNVELKNLPSKRDGEIHKPSPLKDTRNLETQLITRLSHNNGERHKSQPPLKLLGTKNIEPKNIRPLNKDGQIDQLPPLQDTKNLEAKNNYHGEIHNPSPLQTKDIEYLEPNNKWFYKNGEIYEATKHTKYLSYQPPTGGWNNQRPAFEAAVVIATFLQRTLVLRPLAVHNGILELRQKYPHLRPSYKLYNMLDAKYFVPLSELINIKHLSMLVPVQETKLKHIDFMKEYNTSLGLSWRNICRDGLLQPWVDELPSGIARNKKNIDEIRKATGPRTLEKTPKHHQECSKDSKIKPEGIWEFLQELNEVKEQMLYFEKGSLFVDKLFFGSEEQAFKAQIAVIDHIRPSETIRSNVETILNTILGKSYNAIHVRRTDHKTGALLSPEYWLSKLEGNNARNYSLKLYIATDETNKSWFKPFIRAGYKLYFASDIPVFAEIRKTNPITAQDVIAIHEQQICRFSNVFIPSIFSTMSTYIVRARQADVWDRSMFKRLNHSPIRWLDI